MLKIKHATDVFFLISKIGIKYLPYVKHNWAFAHQFSHLNHIALGSQCYHIEKHGAQAERGQRATMNITEV